MNNEYPDDDVRMTPVRGFLLLITAVLVIPLTLAILSTPEELTRLEVPAAERLSESGVGNPVTAVLLNFRGYDTFLEVTILLLAIVGTWAVAPVARIPLKTPNTPVLVTFVRLFTPIMIIVGGYLLWQGADFPGGAFQAGAVLGGMGVLSVAAATWQPRPHLMWLLRPLLVVGLVVFLVVTFIMMLMNGNALEYPEGGAKEWILIIESAATISIGVTLVALFIGGVPGGKDE